MILIDFSTLVILYLAGISTGLGLAAWAYFKLKKG